MGVPGGLAPLLQGHEGGRHHAVPRPVIHSQLIVTKRTAPARRGMVVAEHPVGARVGAAMLEAGGNAVDAAVATAFAMTVVEPFMSTIGGSGTMLVHVAKRGETVAVDFNGCAPGRAHDSMFTIAPGISRGLFAWPNVVGAANDRGYLAVAVPGSVAGLSLALERFGTMELRVDLRNGRAIHRPPTGLEEGDRVTYPDLARSLELIARAGPAAFYRGAIAGAIHEAMAAHGGLITREDLAAYEVRVGSPLVGTYRGLQLAFSPGSTGGITAVEILNILDQFPP